MNKLSKITIIIITIFLIIGIIIVGNKIIEKNKKINCMEEILPEEEISEEQFRQTIVSLYFINKETNEIEVEPRLIDVKTLINSPYETLINMLIAGPKNNKNVSYIPDNVIINKVELNNNILLIDFSNEFTDLVDSPQKEKGRLCIEKTLLELIEVKEIKMTINDKEIS